MILISHRGNINGPDPFTENLPEQITHALRSGYDVEIDVWHLNHCFYLGHDEPKYSVSEKFLENEKLWCHAKNIEALSVMSNNINIHCFWHQQDDVVLTSNGYIWTYPDIEIFTNKSVAVMPENNNKLDDVKTKEILKDCYAVCTDYPKKLKEMDY